MPIRIILVDDQAVIRSGLSAFLRPYAEYQLVGEAANGEEAIQLCDLVKPDVALIDDDLPVTDGVNAIHAIRQRWPKIRLIALGSYPEAAPDKKTAHASADACLLKNLTAPELVATIRKLTGMSAPAELSRYHPLAGEGGIQPEKTWSMAEGPGQHNLERELEAAGKIQSELLPARSPLIPGWEIAARLEPAREMSGDYYDFLPLANNNLGLVIADVSDKGMGAALFMALSCTLIRTYATQYASLPAFALDFVNQRILTHSRSGMFVTAFYGVLEPDTGRLRYVNAGHNPPFFISNHRGKSIDQLRSTGMALGAIEDASWQQKIIRFYPGDTLFLYTDGVTEAQDRAGFFYGEQRLMNLVRARAGASAQDVIDAVFADLKRFTAGVVQQDDIALMAIRRKER